MVTKILPLEYLEKIREGEIRIIRLVYIYVSNQFGTKKLETKKQRT